MQGSRSRGLSPALIAVAAALATLAVGAFVGAQRASAAGPNAPNILIILTDDQREWADTSSVMPQTAQWFQDGGTNYPEAVATTPLCCPSRASIFSGRYVHNHGVKTNKNPYDFDPRYSIQRYLHDGGYETGLFGKYLNEWDLLRNPPYWDKFSACDCGFTGGWRTNENGVRKTINQYSTTYLRDQATQFIQDGEADDARPWFMYVATSAPHLPATPDTPYANAPVPAFQPNPATFEADLSDKPPHVQFLVLDQQAVIDHREAQLRSLMSVDDMVEAIRVKLQQTGELNNTLAIFMSDNGFMWGEHNFESKNRPYLDSIHVPMLVNWPGHTTPGSVDNRYVANIDLTPTALAAAGVSALQPTDGHDIFDPLQSRTHMLNEFFYQGDATIGSWASILTPGSQYIEYYGPNDPDSRSIAQREYYDLTNDPYELQNLLNDGIPGNDPPTAALSAQLAQDRQCIGSNCP